MTRSPRSSSSSLSRTTEKDKVIKIVLKTAKTGTKGTFGDGKIFVSPIEEVYTISKRTQGTLGGDWQ